MEEQCCAAVIASCWPDGFRCQLRNAFSWRASSPFLKKRTKKLLTPLSRALRRSPRQRSQKSFASFLQKRRPCLLRNGQPSGRLVSPNRLFKRTLKKAAKTLLPAVAEFLAARAHKIKVFGSSFKKNRLARLLCVNEHHSIHICLRARCRLGAAPAYHPQFIRGDVRSRKARRHVPRWHLQHSRGCQSQGDSPPGGAVAFVRIKFAPAKRAHSPQP